MDNLKADNHYQPNKAKDNYILSDEQVKVLVKRKADFLAGKTTSRTWSEVKKRYELK
jgi:hypothetical protein